MRQRLLVITPVHNEAAHIERVAAAMAAQTRPPDAWFVIDDGSTDETRQILARLAEQIDFLYVREATPLQSGATADRLALAAEARAFNQALRAAWAGEFREAVNTAWDGDFREPLNTRGTPDFSHIAKLDGDIELPAEYFEVLLNEFRCDPQLGLAGGVLREQTAQGWEIAHGSDGYHVRGALKCYSSACLQAIGGIEERLGWDTIDEIRARMNGYGTRSLPHLVATHHRRLGSASGVLRGRARHGRCVYIARFPLSWVALRALKTAVSERPRGACGAALLAGYLQASFRHDARVEDPAFRTWVRHELAARALTAAGLERTARRAAPGATVATTAHVRVHRS